MKKILALFTILTLSIAPVFAKEPVNLSIVKKEAIRYHDSGDYAKDINQVMNKAMDYLKKRVSDDNTSNNASKKLAVVLDIDETSLSNYHDMKRLDFGGTIEEIRADEDKAEDDAISPTLKLYQFAKANNVAVFFITGRFEEERNVTIANLKKVGYKGWNGLILRDGPYKHVPAAVYKTAMRKQLTEQGYDIILNIGDQESDLAGGYADKTFKLPNPYYFIP